MDLAGGQYDEDNGYKINPLYDYSKADNGVGQTLRSESEDLNRLVDESFEAFSDGWRGDSTDMEADRTLDELGEEQKDSACQFNRSYQPRRLLHITHDGKFTLEEFDTYRDDMPPYAVLSSTSEDGDVVYRDLKSLGRQRNIHAIKGTGWEKIRFCAKQTEHGGPNYFWIETCCVNRASRSEVYDCINATLKRLENAQTCYVLLPDVLNRSLKGDGESAFKKSIWFTQCWTFLDLVVPPSVKFFSKDGTRLGDRISLLNVIQEAIGLPSQNSSVADLSLFNDLSSSDLEVLTLSSHRKIICKGNSVYCMHGKFGCSRVTLFDEDKDRAWQQLQNVIQDKKRRGKIYRWLSAPDHSTDYRKARKLRAPGTGLWFLNSTEYKGWRDRMGSSRLWIQGIAGSGKTILSSTVIESLQKHCRDDASMVTAYFHFDSRDDQKRDAGPMLRALLHQLLQNLSPIPDDIEAFFVAHQAELEDTQRSIGVLLKSLKQVMSYFTQIYIVLDALNGCLPRCRDAFLTALKQMMDWKFDNMHILLTSRRWPNLEASLGPFFNAGEVVSTEHIELDLQKLRHDERLAKWKDDFVLMQEIQTSLAYFADRRDYNAESQLTMLGMCLTQVELRESLETLTKKTDELYDRLLCSVGQGAARYFLRILKWLALSGRPLRSNDMGEIIALNPAEYPNFDSTAFVHACIAHISRQLGILRSERQDMGVARERSYYLLEHCSFRQYLFSNRIKQGPAYQYSLKEEDCHKTIAKDCLEYLLQLQQPLPGSILNRSSLVSYAARHWTLHFQMVGDNKKDLIPLAMRVFSRSDTTFPTWISLYDPDGQLTSPDLESSRGSIAAPLYYAAQLGLSTITTLLLQQGADVNERSGRYGSALQAAAQRGHLDVVKILLDKGANVNAQGGSYGSALQVAASEGYLDIVEILLNMGADVSAQGGQFGSAIHAARVCGHSSVVDCILGFSKATAVSNIAPSDSGYASQRQADSLMCPSIPDRGTQRDYLAEHQSTHQVPSYCDEEINPDDIRSVQSDNESIGSKISTTRSKAELFAVKHLAMFFAQLEDLCSLHEMALYKLERRRFIRNYRRILKSYYKRLLKEAESETEKAVTRVLRSQRNREIIAEGIADQLELDEENEQRSLEKVVAQPVEEQYLEDWLRKTQGTDYEKPVVANQEPHLNDFQVEDSGSDSGFDTESEVGAESETDTEDEFTKVHGAERFLQQGAAFHNLVLDIRLLMLPHHLRQIVETTPKTLLQLIANNNTSWVNNAKAFLESYTGYRWDWWPLAPRIPNLGVGEQHLEWKLSKRTLYTKITPEQAENLCGILDLAVGHPPNCPCCVARHSAEWLMVLKDIFWTAVRSLQSNRQRSAVSGNTSSKAAMAYTPSPNNTSGASSSTATLNTGGSNASGVASNNNSNNGAGSNLQKQRRTPTVPALNVPKAPTRVIFGVQGMRRSLEIEQIEICNQMNDQRFFRELNNRYKKHRWSLQRLLSPFRFQYCNFVKFEKLNVNRIFSFGEGLPDPNGFADDYDYNPKPPQGKIPLIEPGLFAVCLQSCEDDCRWSLLGPWLHDCFQLPLLCDKITCIPKKKSEFPVQCKQVLRDTAWGIEAEYTLSFWMLCVYHLIPLLSSFGFWIYWLTMSPGDWQNASVPTITTIALFAFVWVPFGFVFNTHRPVRYR